MTIDKDTLIALIKMHYPSDPEDQLGHLYIHFDNSDRLARQAVTYSTADGDIVVIDINNKNEIFGIEIY